MLDVAAVCLAFTALLAYVNHRFVRLPTTIGVMAISLGLSLVIVAFDRTGLGGAVRAYEESMLRAIDFSEVLMQGMLSFLLFAGALHLRTADLRAYRWQVGGLAIGGTLLSTLLVGFGMAWALPWVGVELPLAQCLLFGALISPTDPIAVLGILQSAKAPKSLEVVIAGESLFNDGVGVVVFTLLLGIGSSLPTVGGAALLMLQEAGGGVVFGSALGFGVYALLRSVDQYQLEVLLTLAAVVGGYALAQRLHVSGPLAMVMAGLIVGNRARDHAMSDTTRRYVDGFWELIDEMLNAVLFVLLGMEVLLVPFSGPVLLGGGVAVAVTLVARWLCVGGPVQWAGPRFGLPQGSPIVLTWGGLRGGISVALALSMPAGDARDTVLALTYCVVVFSILVQGLTIGRVVRAAVGSTVDRREPAGAETRT